MKKSNYYVSINKNHSSRWDTIAKFETIEEAKDFINNHAVIGYTYRIITGDERRY